MADQSNYSIEERIVISTQFRNAVMLFLLMNVRFITVQEAATFISGVKKIHIFTKNKSTIRPML
jgi:hypothetical protein